MPDETADLKTSEGSSALRDKSLDGLRGLAALNVTIGHFFSAFVPAIFFGSSVATYNLGEENGFWFDVLTSAPVSLLYNSHFAVMVFFVLSGYVLIAPYYQGRGTMILKQRLAGRYLRLNLPLMASVFLSFLLCKLGLYYNVEAANAAGSETFIGPFFTHNITFSSLFEVATYKGLMLGERLYNHPLWTLRFEFIGSIMLLAFYICKPARRAVVLSVIMSAVMYVYFGMESIYLIALFAGACLHNFKVKTQWRWGLAVVGLYFGAFQFSSMFYDFWPAINFGGREIWERGTFYNLIGALMLVIAVANGTGRRVLESKVCQFLGEISYPIYLLHFLIICSLSSAVYLSLPQSGLYIALNLALYLGVCLGVSKVFALTVDQPSIRLSHKFSAYLFKERT